jgi:hypothetical protein
MAAEFSRSTNLARDPRGQTRKVLNTREASVFTLLPRGGIQGVARVAQTRGGPDTQVMARVA